MFSICARESRYVDICVCVNISFPRFISTMSLEEKKYVKFIERYTSTKRGNLVGRFSKMMGYESPMALHGYDHQSKVFIPQLGCLVT